jgi:choline-glycine betaine transporter
MWKKWWLLFTVIWVVVAGIQAATILATSEEQEKALQPIVLGIAVPAALYLIGLIWQSLRRSKK